MKNYAKNRIDLLEEYIRSSSEKTTVESINANSFYSYRHANRLFKSLKGESINSYANKIRIQTSAEYLKYSSKSIFEIALEVGYESTAAFSKAFKKLYGQTPSDFRQTNHSNHLLINTEEPDYAITYFDELNIHIFKTAINPNSTFDEYYHNTKTAFKELNTNAKQWMLLWDEDPGLCKVPECRYFIGINTTEVTVLKSSYRKTTIKGRYAIFNSTSLEKFAYEIWHELACLLLDLDGKQLREAPYVEWFSDAALNTKSKFLPDKIAVPVQ